MWVAKSGGDFTSVKAALDSITDNSSSKPYLVKIAPGVYTEPGGIALKDHVDIEGSGRHATTITCACGPTAATMRATTFGALHAEIRDLTVSNSGGNPLSTAIEIAGIEPDTLVFRDIAAEANGATTSNTAISIGNASPTLVDVIARATATGSATATGVFIDVATPVISGLTAIAESPGTARAVRALEATVHLDGGILTATGGNATGVQSSLSVLRGSDLTVTASGTTEGRGVNAAQSNVLITDSRIEGNSLSVNGTAGSNVHLSTTVLVGSTAGGVTCNDVMGGTLNSFVCA